MGRLLHRGGRRAVLPLVLLAALAGSARAQLASVPVYGGGVTPLLEAGAQLAFPGSDSRTGEGVVAVVTGSVGIGRLGVAASAGRFLASGDGSDRNTYGVLAGVKLIGGDFTPLSIYLQGGLGTMEDDDPDYQQYFIPLGIAATLTIPTPIISVKPWVAPRLDITRTTFQGDSDSNQVFGFSAGVDLTLLGGLSFRASYDYIKNLDPVVAAGAALHF